VAQKADVPCSPSILAGMYEIRIHDKTRHVLAVAETPAEALELVTMIGDQTRYQVAANGEGHRRFVLKLAVWDTERREVVARSGFLG
jgi:fructose 1,6-bisphosphatase